MEETVEDTVENVLRNRRESPITRWMTTWLPLHWRRSLGSLRTHLIVWNIVALSLLLGGLGVVCRYAILSFLMQSVDQELDRNIDMFTRPPRANRGPDKRQMRDGPDGGPPFKPGRWGDKGENRHPEHGGWGERPSGESPPNGHGLGSRLDMPPPGDFHGGNHGPGPFDASNPYRVHHYNAQGGSEFASDTRLTWDKAGLARALQGETVRNTVLVDEEPVRVISAPAFNLQGQKGAVQSAYPLKEVYRALSGVDTVLLLLIPVGLLGAGWMGSALTNRVLRRVQWMTHAAGRIGTEPGSGGFSRRLPVVGSDEFAELADTFNGMLGRLDNAFQEQAQVLELQQRFTADASHELKTPLTIIKGRAGLALSRDTTDERSRRTFGEISEAADSMAHLVQDLLLLARSDEGQMGQDRRELLVGEVLEKAREQALQENRAPIDIQVEPETLTIMGNQAELARLFRNLLDNAVRYTPADGQIRVTARRMQSKVVIAVSDTGSGIAPEHLPHLGKRFYRVDASRTRPTGGTGLGLSICRGIVEAHGGSMTFNSQLGVGTTVTVTLGC